MGVFDDLEQGQTAVTAQPGGVFDQLEGEQTQALGVKSPPPPTTSNLAPAATVADPSVTPNLPPMPVTPPSLAPQLPGPIQQATQSISLAPASGYPQTATPPQGDLGVTPAMQQQFEQQLPPAEPQFQPMPPSPQEQRDETATALADQFIQQWRQQTGSAGLPPEMQTRIFVQRQLNQLGLGRDVVPAAVHLPQYGPEDAKQSAGMGMSGTQGMLANIDSNLSANASNAVGQAGGIAKAKINAIANAMAPLGAADVVEQQQQAGMPPSDLGELTASIQQNARAGVRAGNAQAAANPTDNPGIGFLARNAPAVAGNVAAAAALGPVAGPIAFNSADMGAGMYAQVYEVMFDKAKAAGMDDATADQIANKAAGNAGKLGAGLGAVLGLPIGQALKKFGLSQALESEAAKAAVEQPVIGALSEQTVKDVAAKAALKQIGEGTLHAGAAAGLGGFGGEAIRSGTTGDKFEAGRALEGTGEQLLVGIFSGAIHAMVSDYSGASSARSREALENAIVNEKFGPDLTPEQRTAAIKALRTYRDVVADQKDFSTAAKDNGLSPQDVEAVRNMQGEKSEPTTDQPPTPEGGDSHEQEGQRQEGRRQEVLTAPATPAEDANTTPSAGETASPVTTWSETPGEAVNQLIQRAGDRGVTITGKQAVRTVGAITAGGGDFQAGMDKALDAAAPKYPPAAPPSAEAQAAAQPAPTATAAPLPADVTQANYDKAVEAVKQRGSVSVSHVQRVLMIGYSKATAIVNKMVADGIASPVAPEQGKPRALMQPSTTPPVAKPSTPPANTTPSAQVMQAGSTVTHDFKSQQAKAAWLARNSASIDSLESVVKSDASGKKIFRVRAFLKPGAQTTTPEQGSLAGPSSTNIPSPLDAFEKTGKQPYDVTRAEWTDLQRGHRRSLGQAEQSGTHYAPYSDYEEFHKDAVTKAVQQGKPVPPNVLKDYPDLGPQSPASPTPAAPPPAMTTSATPSADGQGAQTNAGEGSAASGGPGTSTSEEPSSAGSKGSYGKSNRVVTEDRYEKLKQKWKDAMNRTLSGFDPELLSMAAQMAAYHIEAGARVFADFVKAMVGDLGDSVRPYLKSAYIAAKHMPGMELEAKDMNTAHYVEGLSDTDVDSMIGSSHARGSEQAKSPVVQAAGGQPAGQGDGARSVLGGQGGEGDAAGTGGDSQGGGGLPGRGAGEDGAGAGLVRDTGESGDGRDGSQAAGDGGSDLTGAPGGSDAGDGHGRGSGGGQSGRRDVETAEQQQQRQQTPSLSTDHVYTPEQIEEAQSGGLKTKFQRNVEAIRVLRTIEGAGRPATAEEQAVLAMWTGFGALPGAVNPDAESAGDWLDERNQIVDLLTPEEMDPLRRSTLNAHYTAPAIVSHMWDIVRKMGFDGGRVLEPSMGIGYFFGLMPSDLKGASKLTGVELDSLTGRMAKALYPSANVMVKGFEETNHPDNFFDLAIGNVPFGSYRLHDPRYNKFLANIHDYFFLKSVDKVRPGGLVAYVTSTGTMDKAEPRIRKALAEKADLLFAVRFPEGAHQKNAGTAVVTDLLIFRKKGVLDHPGNDFENIGTVPDPARGEPIPINQHFINNPEMVLGTVDRKSRLYGAGNPHVSLTKDYDERLAKALDRVPPDTYLKAPAAKAKEGPLASASTKDGALVLHNGKVHRKNGELLEEHQANAKDMAAVKGMIRVRDALRDVFAKQLAGETQDRIDAARKKLNEVYDDFVAKRGALNKYVNVKAFAGDPDLPLLQAAEKWDREKQQAVKTDVFHKNTIRPQVTVDKADTAQDAVRLSNADLGRVDLPHIAKLLGVGEEEAAGKLVESGAAFLDPEHGWQSAENYLSGNVRQKLKAARDASGSDGKYQPNVDALEKVQPEDVPHDLIDVRLGQPWIPNTDIQEFAGSIMGSIPEHFRVSYSPVSSEYIFDYTSAGERRHLGRPQDVQTWGTKRKSFPFIMEAALNNKRLVVRDKVGDESIVNPEETAAANQKVDELQAKFAEWLWEDDARRRRLHRFYNDTFNNIVPTNYDGSHLTLPGMATEMNGKPFGMRSHQKNAVWRTINNGADLYAHEVGTGKTYTMGAAAMELRRLGLAKKPCIVCLKANVEDVADELKNLYPGARIFPVLQFDGDNRKKAVSQIATGDWDMVVMTHDHIGLLPMSSKTQQQYLQQELQQLSDIILEANDEAKRRNEGKGNKITKDLEKARTKLEEKIKKAQSAASDDAVTFEETGIDHIFVDEAHKFKSLPVYTKLGRVKGIPSATSDRAQMMLMRTRWLMDNNNGRGVTFATGTPIANTVAELFNLQRYLQPKALAERGVAAFDAWAATFGRVTNREEYNVQGDLATTSRFAAFTNLPELRQMISPVVDIIRAKDIPGLVRPRRKDSVVAVSMTDAQKDYLQDIKDRANAIKGQPPVKGGDNMLSISMDARKSAMHMRMVSTDPDEGDGKVDRMIQNVLSIHKDNPGRTQMIFSDLGVNELAKAGGFHLYQYIIKKLGEGGIPADKIVDFTKFNTDSQRGKAEKEKQIARLREGDALVGIGGSDTMGTGVNAQKNLIALHNVDVPWVPANIEQRDGRGVRQGNTNEMIHVIRYVTEGSFDKFMWQTVDAKHRFIQQFMDGDLKVRTMKNEDEEGELSPAQVMALASGDPHQLDRVNLEKDIRELEAGAKRHTRGEIANRDLIKQLQDKIAELDEQKPLLDTVHQHLKQFEGQPFSMKIGDTTYDNSEEAQNALDALIEHKKERWEHTGVIGEHRGYPLHYNRMGGYAFGFRDSLLIDRGAAGKHDASPTVPSIIQNNNSHRAGEKLANLLMQRQRHEADIAKLQQNAGRPFIRAQELEEKKAKLDDLRAKMAAEAAPQETPEQAAARRNARRGFVDLTPLFDAVDKVMEKLRRLAGWVRDVPQQIKDSWNGLAGHSAPQFTRADAESGEAMVRWASSQIAAPLIARSLSTQVLGPHYGDDNFAARLGGVLTEDNLRGVKKGLEDEGDHDAADKVTTLVGLSDSPFPDEQAYQDALHDPDIEAAIERHKQIVMPYAEELYKTASDIAPDEDLPPRGVDTGAFINLKALREDEDPGTTRPVGVRRGNPTNTFTRKSKFNTKAYGNAAGYDIDYNNIVNNSIAAQLGLANQKTAYDTLEKAGLAKVDKSAAKVEIDGEPAVAFPIRRTTIIIPNGDQTKAFAQNRSIFVRPDLAPEFRRIADLDEKTTIPLLTWAAGLANSAALAGVTEAVVHSTNLASALQATPLALDNRVMQKLQHFGGIPKLVAAITATAAKWQELNDDSPDMRDDLAKLAEIGALRGEHPDAGVMSRLIHKLDTSVRLVLDGAFDRLVATGGVKDSETNRREFINRVGQYNHRLQGPLTRILRSTNLGPFSTAGYAFLREGWRRATLSTGIKEADSKTRNKLRVLQLSGLIGGLLLTPAIFNYATTGNVMGRPGTPFGSIDTGFDTKDGRPMVVDSAKLFGYRRALSVTGAGSLIDATRAGKTTGQKMDAVGEDLANSLLSPAFGPLVKTLATAATGYSPRIGSHLRAAKADVGDSQLANNAKEAAAEFNPLTGEAVHGATDKDWTPGEAAGRMSGGLVRPGTNPHLAEQTTFSSLLHDEYAASLPPSQEGQRQIEKYRLESGFAKKIAEKTPGVWSDMAKAVQEGKLNKEDMTRLAKSPYVPAYVRYAEHLDALDLLKAWKEGDPTPEERKHVYPLLVKKITHSKSMTVAEKLAALKEIREHGK